MLQYVADIGPASFRRWVVERLPYDTVQQLRTAAGDDSELPGKGASGWCSSSPCALDGSAQRVAVINTAQATESRRIGIKVVRPLPTRKHEAWHGCSLVPPNPEDSLD